MSAPKPVGHGECRLVIALPSGERTIAFCTLADAIRCLHHTLLKATGGSGLNGYVGPRAPRVEVDHRAACIVWVRETPDQRDHNQFGATWAVRREWATYTLVSQRGRIFNVSFVMQLLGAHAAEQGMSFRTGVQHGVRGTGPVRGIHKLRGGFGFLRNVRTFAERQQNAMTIDGEPQVRYARHPSNLPTSWSDGLRGVQRSWKKQRKGAKQWAWTNSGR